MFLNLFYVVALGLWHFDQVSAQSNDLSREKRFVYLPPNDGIGLGAALAIPLDNGRGDVFVSYCINSNYNVPTYSVDYVSLDPPPFGPMIYGDTVDDRQLGDLDTDAVDVVPIEPTVSPNERDNKTVKAANDSMEKKTEKMTSTGYENSATKRRMRNSFISRKKFYQVVENKMFQHGLNAKKCLLRAICEVNLYELGELNGVLGDFIHIMFSPTTSKDENLPKKYYVAEQRGRNGESCEKAYGKECPDGIFDLITIIK